MDGLAIRRGGIHACGANTEAEKGSSGEEMEHRNFQWGGRYGGRKRAFLGLLMAGLAVAFWVRCWSSRMRVRRVPMWRGRGVIPMSVLVALARDDGAPDLVNDGDNDADDVALSVTAPPPWVSTPYWEYHARHYDHG